MLLSYGSSWAQQEYRVEFNKGKIVLDNVNGVEIQGYNGHEVIIVSEDEIERNHHKGHDARAEGLRLISSSGDQDNTGLGLSVKQDGKELVVTQVKSAFDCVDVKVMVPKTIDVRYVNNQITACELVIREIEREIEVSKNYESVEFIDVTGPMSIKVIYGDIDGNFKRLSQDGSISLISMYGDVEVELPNDAPADLLMKTGYGDVYSNFDIKMKNNLNENCNNSWFGTYIEGQINGGGVEFITKATYGDIYFKKSKK